MPYRKRWGRHLLRIALLYAALAIAGVVLAFVAIAAVQFIPTLFTQGRQ